MAQIRALEANVHLCGRRHGDHARSGTECPLADGGPFGSSGRVQALLIVSCLYSLKAPAVEEVDRGLPGRLVDLVADRVARCLRLIWSAGAAVQTAVSGRDRASGGRSSARRASCRPGAV